MIKIILKNHENSETKTKLEYYMQEIALISAGLTFSGILTLITWEILLKGNIPGILALMLLEVILLWYCFNSVETYKRSLLNWLFSLSNEDVEIKQEELSLKSSKIPSFIITAILAGITSFVSGTMTKILETSEFTAAMILIAGVVVGSFVLNTLYDKHRAIYNYSIKTRLKLM